jgi:hypothetical protein
MMPEPTTVATRTPVPKGFGSNAARKIETCHLIFAPDRVDAIDSNKAARSYFELALEGNARANNLLSSLCLDASRAASSTLSTLGSLR